MRKGRNVFPVPAHNAKARRDEIDNKALDAEKALVLSRLNIHSTQTIIVPASSREDIREIIKEQLIRKDWHVEVKITDRGSAKLPPLYRYFITPQELME